MQRLLAPAFAVLFAGLCGCDHPGKNDPATSNRENEQVTELKEKLWAAIRAKNADQFVDCYFIEERFNTPEVREANRKQIETLLREETVEVEVLRIPDYDLVEVRKVQDAKPDTLPRYSLEPRMMIRVRQVVENRARGRVFFIGEQKGKWYIVTLAGHTT